jgi:N-carbamoyl-L-amino-acid hydrolase
MARDLNTAAVKAGEAVDGERLWASLMHLAQFGARPDGGVERHALSGADIAARAWLIGEAERRDLAVSVDDAANLWIRRAGRDGDADPVIAGSHMDSQPAGGRFDGALGVMAALEALGALDDAGIVTERPIDVVAWTNEEGGRFDRGCTGSSVWSGAMELEDYLGDTGADGVRLGEALKATLEATPGLARRPRRFAAHAYVELHIEQGPVLEAEHLEIAAVTGIQGVRWLNVEIAGHGSHAGTTPMAVRRDAVQAALRAIAALNDLMADPDDVVRFTVGRFNVSPNSPNTVPERVAFTIDFRHPDKALLDQRTARIAPLIAAAASPCTASVTPTLFMDPTPFPEAMIATIETAARGLGHPARRLASGAFHDALYAALVCPAGMVFVPCRAGLSHHPDEWSEPGHCRAGARVLAASLASLAGA